MVIVCKIKLICVCIHISKIKRTYVFGAVQLMLVKIKIVTYPIGDKPLGITKPNTNTSANALLLHLKIYPLEFHVL